MDIDAPLPQSPHYEDMGTLRLSLPRSSIDCRDLIKLYVDDRHPMMEVALRLGSSATTIGRRLRRFGVAIRPRGPDTRRARGDRTITWSADLAWAVGLITTDGNLARDGRHLSVSSKDRDLLEILRGCVGVRARVTAYKSGAGTWYWHLQWSDRLFHAWLVAVGLTPAKSLTLGPLAVPDAYVPDFLRGCVDGDGSIVTYVDRYHATKNPRYVYTRLVVSLVSASPPFLEWMRSSVARLRSVKGSLRVEVGRSGRPIARLKYGKRASLSLIAWMYYADGLPCLARKRRTAVAFVGDAQRIPGRGVSRGTPVR